MKTDRILLNIRFKRQELNYSQQYMASLLEMNQANYNKIENGRVELSVSAMLKIAHILNLTTKDLFNDERFSKQS
ncbi:helix-turn-helix domain-containing protein [Flavobacterium sp.]